MLSSLPLHIVKLNHPIIIPEINGSIFKIYYHTKEKFSPEITNANTNIVQAAMASVYGSVIYSTTRIPDLKEVFIDTLDRLDVKVTKLDAEEVQIARAEVLEGADQTVTLGSNKAITFRVDGDFTKFKALYRNGVLVETSNYIVEAGSIIITLKADYIKTLPIGKHTFSILSTDGEASVNITVIADTSATEPENPSDGKPFYFSHLYMLKVFSLFLSLV